MVQDEGFENFQFELKQKMKTLNVQLNVYCTGYESAEGIAVQSQSDNLDILRSMTDGQEPCIARGPMEIRSLFGLKEYSATAYYSGPLTFGDKLMINVKVKL